MEEVIKKIIDIEKKAQERLNSTYEEKEAKEKELAEIVEHLEDKLIKDAYQKVEQIREREITLANEEVEVLREKCSKKVEAIDAYYNELVDMWCDRLYNTVLKR